MHKGLLVWILSNLTGLVLAHSGNSAVSEEMMSPNPLSGQWAEHRDSYLFRHNPDAGWLNIKKEPQWISTPDKWAAVISHCDDQECYPIIDETETAESESPTVSALYAEMTREYSLASKQTLNANFAPAPSPLITVIFESSLGLIRPFWLSVSDYMAFPQSQKPEQDSDMKNHTGREQAQDGSDRLQEIIKQKKSPPRQPIIILEGEFEEEKRLLYFDHYDHLSIAPVKPVEHDWYHTITIDNAHIGWQDLSGEMNISLLFENNRHNEFDSGFYEEMTFLIRLFGHNRIVLRYTNNSGEIIYEYRDHYGRIRTVTAEELKQWLSERRQAMLEKVYPEFFGTALLPGGGEKPELWRQEHRHVPFSTLRLIARLIIESEEKIDLRHSIARNIRKVPGNEEPNKKNAPAPDPDNPSCKVSQTKALHHPGNNEPDQTPLTSHEQLDSTPKSLVISLRDRLDSIIEKSVDTEDLLSHLDTQILDELADITKHDNGDVLSYLIKKLTDRERLDRKNFRRTTGEKLIPILLLAIGSNESVSYENYCHCTLNLSKMHSFHCAQLSSHNFLRHTIDHLKEYIMRLTYKKIEDRLQTESLDGEPVLFTLETLNALYRAETHEDLCHMKMCHASKFRELALELLFVKVNIADIIPTQVPTILMLLWNMIKNRMELKSDYFEAINVFFKICLTNFLSLDNSQIADLFYSTAMLGETIETTHIINLIQSLNTHSEPLAFNIHDRTTILNALGAYYARYIHSQHRESIRKNMCFFFENLIKEVRENLNDQSTEPIKSWDFKQLYRIRYAIEVAAFWLDRKDDIPKAIQERTPYTQSVYSSQTHLKTEEFLRSELARKKVTILSEQRPVSFLSPVDILLTNENNGKQVIIEVQGPYHYIDGRNEENGYTWLKLTILRESGYTVLTTDAIKLHRKNKENPLRNKERDRLLKNVKAYLDLTDTDEESPVPSQAISQTLSASLQLCGSPVLSSCFQEDKYSLNPDSLEAPPPAKKARLQKPAMAQKQQTQLPENVKECVDLTDTDEESPVPSQATPQVISQTLLAVLPDLPQAGDRKKVSEKDTISIKKTPLKKKKSRGRRTRYRSKKAMRREQAELASQALVQNTQSHEFGSSAAQNKQTRVKFANKQTMVKFANNNFHNNQLCLLFQNLTGDRSLSSVKIKDSHKQMEPDYGNQIRNLFWKIKKISRNHYFAPNDLPKFLPFMSFLYCNVRYLGSRQLIKIFIHYVDSWPLVSKPKGIAGPSAPGGVAASATIFKIQHMFIKGMIDEILTRNRKDIKKLLPNLIGRIRALSKKLIEHDHLMSYILNEAEKIIREK